MFSVGRFLGINGGILGKKSRLGERNVRYGDSKGGFEEERKENG